MWNTSAKTRGSVNRYAYAPVLCSCILEILSGVMYHDERKAFVLNLYNQVEGILLYYDLSKWGHQGPNYCMIHGNDSANCAPTQADSVARLPCWWRCKSPLLQSIWGCFHVPVDKACRKSGHFGVRTWTDWSYMHHERETYYVSGYWSSASIQIWNISLCWTSSRNSKWQIQICTRLHICTWYWRE